MPDIFEFAQLVGTPEQELALHTRRRTQIANAVGPPSVRWGDGLHFRDLAKEYGWSVRCPPNGVYNCAGLVWASRRTCIHDTEAYELILKEDDYRLLPEGERPRIGDLIVYRRKDNREILHVGSVARVAGWAVKVLSKLGPTAGEAFHDVSDVPYERMGFPFWHEFYTDRPVETEGIEA